MFMSKLQLIRHQLAIRVLASDRIFEQQVHIFCPYTFKPFPCNEARHFRRIRRMPAAFQASNNGSRIRKKRCSCPDRDIIRLAGS